MTSGCVEILLDSPHVVRQAHHEREQETVRPELVEGSKGERKIPLSPPFAKGEIGGFGPHVVRPTYHERLALRLSIKP